MNRTVISLIIISLAVFLPAGSLFGQLNGTYTIKPSGTNYTGDPQGSSGKNYTSIKNAVQALKSYGVSGEVVFDIDSGTYEEQIEIPEIQGASYANKIIFQSAKKDSQSVVVKYSAGRYDSNWVISLNGADFIIIRHLKIIATSNIYSIAIELKNDASFNQVSNCQVYSYLGSSDIYGGIVIKSSNVFLNNIISNNYINGGCYGINLYNWGVGNIVKGNVIENFYSAGIFAYRQDSLIIAENSINGSISSTLYGLKLQSCINSNRIYGNKIVISSNTYCYGIYHSGVNEALIYNNFISVEGQGTGEISGIYLSGCSFHSIYFNSVYTGKSNAANVTCYTLYSTGYTIPGRGSTLYNNILTNFGDGYVIYTSNMNQIAYSDYNNFFTSGILLFYMGKNFLNLSDWYAYTLFDLHSFNVDPVFQTKTNLYINHQLLKNAGLFLSDITTDIDNESRDMTPDIGADEFVLMKNDVGILDIITPIVICPDTIPIWINIKNFGTDTLKSVTVNWEINGKAQSAIQLTTLNLPQYSFITPKIGTFVPQANSWYNIKVTLSNPNGKSDEKPDNNSFDRDIRSGLSGEYVIGGSGADYQTISDAIKDLKKFGICGPVKFRIKAGEYAEQIAISQIPGVSDQNNIIFESYDKDSTKVIISFFAITSSNLYTIKLDGADYITFRYLTVICKGNTQTNAILMCNGATFNVISNCIIKSEVGLLNDRSSCVNVNSSAENLNNNYNTILNNRIIGGYKSIIFNAISSATDNSNSVKDNIISDFNFCAIEMNAQTDVVISGNLISSNKSYSKGIRMYSCKNVIFIFDNKIKLTSCLPGSSGIELQNCMANSKTDFMMYNNFILMKIHSGSSGFNGIYLSYIQNLNCIFNTVRLEYQGVIQNSNAIYIKNISGLFFTNNIFLNLAGGYTYYMEGISGNSFDANYNDLYSNGSYLVKFYNDVIKNLSDWKKYSGKESKSIAINPSFYEEDNYHVFSSALDGAGCPISGINTDIDGEKRNLNNPDIGADEFTVYPYDAAMIKIVSPYNPCDSTSTDIAVKIVNAGTKTITQIKIAWSVDGNVQTPKSFTTFIQSGKDTIFYVGNYMFFKNRNYQLKIWVDSINSQKDMQNNSDTLTAVIHTAMKGYYSIGKSGRDFKTIMEAVNALESIGVCDKVVFNIDPDIYYEQCVISDIPGISDLNTVTFQSATQNSEHVILTTNSHLTENNYIILLNSVQNVHFRYLTFSIEKEPNMFYMVYLNGINRNIEFQNNRFISKSSYTYAIYFDYKSINENILIKRNEFEDNTYSIYFRFNNVLTDEKFITVDSNLFLQGNGGILGDNVNGVEITNNDFQSIKDYAIGIYNCSENLLITGNKIKNLNKENYGFTGIILTRVDGKKDKRVIIANNFIVIGSPIEGNIAGIDVNACMYLGIYYNTIVINSVDNTGSTVYFNCPKNYNPQYNELKNNILANFNNGNVLSLSNYAVQYKSLGISDYNCFYTEGKSFATYASTNVPTFQKWVADTKFDNHSIFGQPGFKSYEDLHLTDYDYLKLATPITEVTTDIDGENRSPLWPTIGADDINTRHIDASVSYIIEKEYSVCEGLNDIRLKISNLGLVDIDTFILSVSFNRKKITEDTFNISLSYMQDTVLNLGKDTFQFIGPNELQVRLMLPQWMKDEDTLNNTIKIDNFKIIRKPKVSFVKNDNICENDNARLEIHGDGMNYFWYYSPQSEFPFQKDSIYDLIKCKENKIFYATAVNILSIPDSINIPVWGKKIGKMGYMFNIQAKEYDIFMESIGVMSSKPSGYSFPVTVYFRSGFYKGFETNPSEWNLLSSETIQSNGPDSFSNIKMKNFKIEANNNYSFYVTSTKSEVLLTANSFSGVKVNDDLQVSNASILDYPFKSGFQTNTQAVIDIHYTKQRYCESERYPVSVRLKQKPDTVLTP